MKKNKIALTTGSLVDIENALKIISKKKLVDFVPLIIKKIQLTKNPLLRNELAISLRDLRADNAVPVLIKLIHDPKNAGYTGTLVWALQKLECRDYFLDVVYFLINGNFETAEAAMTVIKKYKNKIPVGTKKIAVDLLKYGAMVNGEDKDKIYQIGEVLELLK